MNLYYYLKYLKLVLRKFPYRYRNLFKIIKKNRCHNIVEIGVFDGVHAQQMIETAKIHFDADQINYYGFDLFEDLSKEILTEELSKKPITYDEIKKKLQNTGANIELYN